MNSMIRSLVLGLIFWFGCYLEASLAYVTDTNVYPAPNYYTFQPPLLGGSYTDPVFGTAIQRMTSALTTLNPDGGNLMFVTGEYSTMSPFNLDNSRILVQYNSGYNALLDGSGNFLKVLPAVINASSEPRWSRSDPNLLYYHVGNQLKQYNVSTDAASVVHTFSEYSTITGNGESDISFDGNHFVFAGDGRYVFVYEISTDTKGSVFDTGGRGFDSLYITPNNNVTITWLQAGTSRYNGIEFFDRNMNFQRQVAHAGGHMDVTLDTDGSEVLVWTNSADALPLAGCNNGFVKIKLSTGQQTCLLSLDWSLAVHVSAPDNSGWVFAETYAPSDPNPQTSGWVPYTNEILQIKLDGTEVRRILHHRSRPFNSYNWTPRASVSRDGTRFTFNSNYGLQAILGYTSEYSDVYLVVLSGTTGAAPSIITSSLPSGTQNTAYNATLTATGGTAPYTWSIVSGILPAGLTLGSSTGVISGTPTGTGTSSFTVQVMDAISRTAAQALSLTVNPPPPSITTSSLPTGTQSTAYSATLTATGGTTPFTWSIVSGNLPAGLTLRSSIGVISGTPTGTGTSSFTVQVTDASSLTATKTLSLTINPGGSTTRTQDNSSAVVYAGTWYPVSRTFFDGGTATAAMDAGATATISFVGSGISWIGYRDEWSGIAQVYLDGSLVGTVDTYSSPAVAGAVLYTVTGLAGGSHTLTIRVLGQKNSSSGGAWVWVDAFDVTVTPPSITTTSLPTGTQNTAYTATLAATSGTTPYTWSLASGTLPAGLTLAASTGAISGTPTGTGTSSFTVQVTDANSLMATKALSLTVNPPPPSITTTSLPSGTQYTPYSSTLAATGGTMPYTWSIVLGSLPVGLTLAASTGVISGTPTGTGTSNFTVQVADVNSQTATKALSLTVNPPPPSITTTSLPSGTQYTAYSATLTATGGTTPYTWSIASGSLPVGLTLAASTGVISGTPTGTGTSSFSVRVTDANSRSATKALSIAINSGTPITIQQDNSAASYVGSWFPVSRSFFNGGTATTAMDNGSTATVSFVGTAISWIGYRDAWSGIAVVSVDGNTIGNIDTYSPTDMAQTVIYTITGLSPGNHKLTVQATGQKNQSSGGAWVWVDAFKVTP